MTRCFFLMTCLIGGCVYHPVYEGIRCGPDGQCPPGFECTQIEDRDVCTESGSLDGGPDAGDDRPDAGTDAGDPPPADQGPVDAGDPGQPDAGPVCGDNQVSGNEVCDDGINDGSYGGCMPDCLALGPHCGDGEQNGDELCDHGVNNGGYNGCAPDCMELGPFCGDGIKNGPEECDQADHGGTTCQSLGFLTGSMICDTSCILDASTCECPYHRSIAVDVNMVGSSTSLINFPVLVQLQGDYLRHVDDGGQVLSPEGHDIVFRHSDAASILSHELVEYSSDSVEGRLSAWVRLPEVYPDRDTPFFMCFGGDWIGGPSEDPPGVWSDGYAGVWHLDEDAGPAGDSTANQLHGTFEGSLPDRRTGILAGAQHFSDASHDQVRVGQHPALDITQAITISAWISPEHRNQQFRLIGKWYTNSSDWSYVLYARSVEGFRLWNGHNFVELTSWSTEVANDTWQYLAATYDGTLAQVFINGALVGQQQVSNTIAVTTNDLLFGNDGYDNHLFRGLIDEVRISNTARSPGWIATEYNNQSNPASFCRVAP